MADDASTDRRDGGRWLTLVAVCGATFMLLVDLTVVQVALPTIQRRFGSSFTDIQWVIDAYALALATLILTWGSLADRFGRKRVFIIGLAVFTAASLLCGLAQSTEMLIWSRAVQGLGGGAMLATGLALIGQEYHGVERGRAIAAWGATVGGAVAVGPLVGGALTSGLGWRWIFIVNAPIGFAAIWLSSTQMRNQRDPGATRLDLPGVATFSAMMFLLEFALIRANEVGWQSAATISTFAAAIVFLVLFVIAELRQQRPMFDLSLFRKPAFTGVCIGTFAIGAGLFAVFPYLTFYLQNDLGYSPFQGGLRLLPSTILTFFVPLAIRRATDRLPAGPLFSVGLAICTGGAATFLLVDATSSWTALVPGLLLTGLGVGIANPAMAKIALGVVDPARSGMASGINNTFRIGGLATGVAALGAIFQQRITNALVPSVGGRAGELGRVISSSGVRAAAHLSGSPGFAATARIAYASGLRTILVIGAVVVGCGVVASVFLVRSGVSKPVPGPVQSGSLEREEVAAFEA